MVRMTEQEFAAISRKAPKKQPRVRNAERVEVDGITFDSKREAQRWGELQLELRAGRITKLRRQVPFSLSVNGEHIAKYVADFVYEREGQRVVEDAKGWRTEIYRIKRKLMAACHGITVVEV